MNARWIPAIAIVLAAMLGACQRADAPSATQSMGAAPASSPAPAASPPAAAVPLVPAQVATAAPGTQADFGAGRQLASQGAAGAPACAGCHGANGEGNAQAGFPRLAGLGAVYIEHQLNSYADGSRTHAVMSPIATALNAQQRSAAAAFYASLQAQAAGTNATGNAPALAVRGDERRGIQACANCHGPGGIGDAAANPYLAGQHAPYLTATLAAWKDGTRRNDPSGQMPAIARALGDADTRELVAYFARQPAPGPRNAQAAAAPRASNRATVQSGPVAATAPAQGTGVTQPGPVTGGAQGPGAGGAATNPSQSPNR